MKKNYKKIIVFFITIMILIMAFTIPVKANKYSGFRINSADYNITLNEDGSARVVENWHIEYFNNGNTFAERFILKKSDKIAERNTMEDLDVYIDEVICSEVKDEKYKEDYTYYVSENNKSYKIYTFLTSKENDKRHITIAYTLKDLIKSVDDKYYYVNFDAFPITVDRKMENIEMTFRLYNGEPIELVENPQVFPILTTVSVENGNLLTYASSIRESKHYISFKILNDCFNISEENQITEKDIKDDINTLLGCFLILLTYFVLHIAIIKLKRRSLKLHMNKKRVIYSVLMLFILSIISAPYYILALMFLVYLIFGLFYGFKQEDISKKLEENTKELKRNPEKVTEIIYKYKNQIDYKDLLDYVIPYAHLSLFARIADASQKKLLTISDNGNITFELEDKNKDPLFKILKDIKKYCDKKEIQYINNNGQITLPLNAFKEYFKKITNYRFAFTTFHPTINNVIDKYHEKIKDKNSRKEFQNDCLMLVNITEIPNAENISFSKFLQEPITPQSYISFLRNDLKNKAHNQDYNAIDYVLYEIYKEHVELCNKKKCYPDTGLPINE